MSSRPSSPPTPTALVTDVASVKSGILAELRERGADVARYLGTHPMAGRERGGAISARADLFLGRPWVITPHAATAPTSSTARIEDLALDLGATPVRMTPEEHDRGVALVSHVPQLVASLLAARLRERDRTPRSGSPARACATRPASRAATPSSGCRSSAANAAPVARVLRDYRDDLDARDRRPRRARGIRLPARIAETLAAGNQGVARIPGKHGTRRPLHGADRQGRRHARASSRACSPRSARRA